MTCCRSRSTWTTFWASSADTCRKSAERFLGPIRIDGPRHHDNARAPPKCRRQRAREHCHERPPVLIAFRSTNLASKQPEFVGAGGGPPPLVTRHEACSIQQVHVHARATRSPDSTRGIRIDVPAHSGVGGNHLGAGARWNVYTRYVRESPTRLVRGRFLI